MKSSSTHPFSFTFVFQPFDNIPRVPYLPKSRKLGFCTVCTNTQV